MTAQIAKQNITEWRKYTWADRAALKLCCGAEMGREGLRRNQASHCWAAGQEHEGEIEPVMLADWKTCGKSGQVEKPSVIAFPSWWLHFSAMLLQMGAQPPFLGVPVHFFQQRSLQVQASGVWNAMPLGDTLQDMFSVPLVHQNQNQKCSSIKEYIYINTSIYLIVIFILAGWHLFVFASFDL